MKRFLLVMFVMSSVIGINKKDKKHIVGLAEQCGQLLFNEPEPITLLFLEALLRTDNVVTIEDFEYCIYDLLERVEEAHLTWAKSSSCVLPDHLDNHVRDCVELLLIFLEQYGSRIKNHDALVYNTQAFNWTDYRTAKGNYDFKSNNAEKIEAIIDEITEGIERAYRESK